jgi:hypothetical protein
MLSITNFPAELLANWQVVFANGRTRYGRKMISIRKQENLAASYSRASYTGTTIGNAAFDGRVRDGIGSDHSFMATKKMCWSVVGCQLLHLPTVLLQM